MDSPIWSNDLLYLNEMILTLTVTAIVIGVCFYISRRADRRRTLRLARAQDDRAKTPAPEAPPTD